MIDQMLKYQLCRRGNELIYKFCDVNKIWYKNCGKIIVSKEEEIDNFFYALHVKAS